MSIVYESRDVNCERIDHASAEAAAAHIEAAGTEGEVIKWNTYKDLYGNTRRNSCALWVCEDGKWFRTSIFSGSGDRLAAERPF